MLGIHSAVNRPNEAEQISVFEAVSLFTSGAAWAVHQEDRRGKLEPGFACDMTVLDLDPLRMSDPASLLRARVLMTVINGDVVFERP